MKGRKEEGTKGRKEIGSKQQATSSRQASREEKGDREQGTWNKEGEGTKDGRKKETWNMVKVVEFKERRKAFNVDNPVQAERSSG
ncbi:MAG: hypothetical protein LBL13_02000 [Bacteroidales bacterium]|nr:hypothetical protein [Bacteroidales bacterium]